MSASEGEAVVGTVVSGESGRPLGAAVPAPDHIGVGDRVTLQHTNGDTATVTVQNADVRPSGFWIGNRSGQTYTSFSGWAVIGHEPKVDLPTEPGTVIAIGSWWLVRLAVGEWVLLPARSESALLSMRRAGVHSGAVYADDWVLAEAQQEGSFRIIAEPRGAAVDAVLDEVRARAITSTSESVTVRRLVLDNIASELGATS